jgi:gas vesicle protein
MTEDNQKSGNGFLLGAAIGAAVGVVTVLLLAPKAGKDLRQGAVDRVKSASERTCELANEARQKAMETAKQAGETAVDLSGKAIDVARQAAHTAVAVGNNVHGWVKDLRSPGLIDITPAPAQSTGAVKEAEPEAAPAQPAPLEATAPTQDDSDPA